MSDITDAIDRRRSRRVGVCHVADWLIGLELDDQIALSEYAHERPASAFVIAEENGFLYSRSVWTLHFRGRCICPKIESGQ